VNHFNGQKIRTDHETISSYPHFLKQAYLIHEVSRYRIKAKELLAGVRKYYLNDVKFRNYSMIRMDTGLSQNLETMVFLPCLSAGNAVFVGIWNDKEIDFIVESGNDRVYLQVAYLLAGQMVIECEFGNLESIQDHYPRKVITLNRPSNTTWNLVK
jgi:predicted AAA+ superfamily ATPase